MLCNVGASLIFAQINISFLPFIPKQSQDTAISRIPNLWGHWVLQCSNQVFTSTFHSRCVMVKSAPLFCALFVFLHQFCSLLFAFSVFLLIDLGRNFKSEGNVEANMTIDGIVAAIDEGSRNSSDSSSALTSLFSSASFISDTSKILSLFSKVPPCKMTGCT